MPQWLSKPLSMIDALCLMVVNGPNRNVHMTLSFYIKLCALGNKVEKACFEQ
jgi:hypothetical protein